MSTGNTVKYTKRHKQKSMPSNETLEIDITGADDCTMQHRDKDKCVTKKEHRDKMSKRDKAIKAFYDIVKQDGIIKSMEKEFEEVEKMVPDVSQCTAWANAKTKNRSADIMCLDATRVKLQGLDNSDYIHANKVTLGNQKCSYIVTQAPLPDTAEDFWRMIFHEDVSTLVVFLSKDEYPSINCPEFFPADEGSYRYYKSMFVNNKKVERVSIKQPYQVFTLEVLPNGMSNSNFIKLILLTAIDKARVANGIHCIQRLIRHLLLDKTSISSCCVVSMDGTGRAGLLLAQLQAVHQLYISGECPNIKEIVLNLRKQRAHCVANYTQYVDIYFCALKFISTKKPEYKEAMMNFSKVLEKELVKDKDGKSTRSALT